MKFATPNRRYSVYSSQRMPSTLFLAISVVSRHREVLRAQWHVGHRKETSKCLCTLHVTTGKLKYDKEGHAKRNSWAFVTSGLPQSRIIGSLQKAFERAGIEDYKVTDEEEALRDLAEYMGYFDYILVRHGYEENYSVSGCAKTTRR